MNNRCMEIYHQLRVEEMSKGQSLVIYDAFKFLENELKECREQIEALKEEVKILWDKNESEDIVDASFEYENKQLRREP